MAVPQNYLRDRGSKLLILVALALITHVVYTIAVRPYAAAWIAEQRAYVAATPGAVRQRSLFVIIRDPEQQATITIALWALILAGLRFYELKQQRRLLDDDLMRMASSIVILPSDAREYLRSLEELPPKQRDAVVPRVLRSALKRFGTTGNAQDASTTVHNASESELGRLDAELAILRFCVWAGPAIGFVGTVRGIGLALEGADLAIQGDISAVTGGLGVAFNSTLVALLLSIVLMYVLHEIQLTQERLVLDTEQYAEEQLVSRLHTGALTSSR
ncbi:MAG TPA: MotA/TolQ/ExbB proton channel family protein [Gammaproteobacteria bacterium]|nr:MotA/TolQ/ExbB proton channel family protein [Gammaproteobacteria bacterium]